MTDSSGFASLSPSLLARKGQARPAMRPQASLMQAQIGASQPSLDDLGWNDMGDDQPQKWTPGAKSPTSLGMTPMPVAEVPPVLQQQAELSDHFSTVESDEDGDDDVDTHHVPLYGIRNDAAQDQHLDVVVPIETIAPSRASRVASSARKSAFTLRLDSERHLQLRIACALNHRSAQQIVTQALDAFLATQPSLAALSGRSTG